MVREVRGILLPLAVAAFLQTVAATGMLFALAEKLSLGSEKPQCSLEDWILSQSLLEAAEHLEHRRYEDAIEIFSDLLPAVSRRARPEIEATIHLGLGGAYQGMGDQWTAALYLQRALETFRSLGSWSEVATTLQELTLVLKDTGDLPGAKVLLEEALGIWYLLGDQAALSKGLGTMAYLSADSGDLETGIAEAKAALELSRDPADQARFLVALAIFNWRLEDYSQAADFAVQASHKGMEVGDIGSVLGGQSLLAISLLMIDEPQRAYGHLINAIDFAELMGVNIASAHLKSIFLERFFDLYSLAVMVAVDLGQPREAFRHAEQAKARAFIDQIWNQPLERSSFREQRGPQEAELLEKEIALHNEIRSEQRKPLEERDQAAIDQRREELALVREARFRSILHHRALMAKKAELHGSYSNNLEDVQRSLPDDQTTLIEYFLTNTDRSSGGAEQVFAWVIDKKGFEFTELPTAPSKLVQDISRLRDSLRRRADVRPLAAELYQDLFAPLLPHVKHRKLIIVPHGVLHHLPFALLRDARRKRYLIDDYILSYAPSATFLVQAKGRGRGSAQRTLILGDPDGSLVHAAEEARAVARLYGAVPLLGPRASESEVVRAEPIGVLHLAAHGIYDPIYPLLSRIELAPDEWRDGRLEMHEVLTLDLSETSLVVLSACRTEAEETSPGDELSGLPRAFLVAGAGSVVSSLWEVDDHSTSLLMQQFHSLRRDGKSTSESLRESQLKTRKRFPHPYDWAAFTLIGAAR